MRSLNKMRTDCYCAESKKLDMEELSIAIIDEDVFFKQRLKKILLDFGANKVVIVDQGEAIHPNSLFEKYNIIIADYYAFLSRKHRMQPLLRASDFPAKVLIMLESISTEKVLNCAKENISGIILKTTRTNWGAEISKIIDNRRSGKASGRTGSSLSETSLDFLGLSAFETDLVDKFASGFPGQKELAYQLEKSDGYVRKAFSNIYRKLNLENSAQLAHLLTALMLWERQKS